MELNLEKFLKINNLKNTTKHFNMLCLMKVDEKQLLYIAKGFERNEEFQEFLDLLFELCSSKETSTYDIYRTLRHNLEDIELEEINKLCKRYDIVDIDNVINHPLQDEIEANGDLLCVSGDFHWHCTKRSTKLSFKDIKWLKNRNGRFLCIIETLLGATELLIVDADDDEVKKFSLILRFNLFDYTFEDICRVESLKQALQKSIHHFTSTSTSLPLVKK